MRHISEVLPEIKTPQGAKNEWAYWVGRCSELGGRPFGFYARKFKGIKPRHVRDFYLAATEWKVNPPALLHKLIREI